MLWVTTSSILEAYPVIAALNIERRYTALEEPKRALQPARELVTGATHQCRRMLAHPIGDYMHKPCFSAKASQLVLILTAGTGGVVFGPVAILSGV